MNQTFLGWIAVAALVFSPVSAGAQADGGADAAATDAAVTDGAVTDGAAAPHDASRPAYPLVGDEGGQAWVCEIGHSSAPSRGVPAALFASLALVFTARRKRAS